VRRSGIDRSSVETAVVVTPSHRWSGLDAVRTARRVAVPIADPVPTADAHADRRANGHGIAGAHSDRRPIAFRGHGRCRRPDQ
jgi:hypothetical protein